MSDVLPVEKRGGGEGASDRPSSQAVGYAPEVEQALQALGFAELPAPLQQKFIELIAEREEALATERDRLHQAGVQAEILRRINRHLIRADTAEELLAVLAGPGLEAGASHAHLLYVDSDRGGTAEWAEVAAAWQRTGASRFAPGTRFHLADFPSTQTLMARPEDVHLVKEVAIDERLDAVTRELLLGADHHTLAIIPLSRPGYWIGFLTLGWDRPHRFSDQEVAIYQALIHRASSAVENRRLLAQTQKALADIQQSERLLHSLIDATPDWIFVKDRHHRFQLVNRSYAEAFQRTPDAFVGKDNLEMGWPEELVRGDPARGIRGIWADDREVMESGQIKLIREDLVKVNGELRVFDTIKIPLHDAAGQVWGLLGFARDMTELKRAEEELRTYRDQLEELVQQRTAQLIASNEQLYVEISERKRVEAALRQSQELLQSVMDHVPQAIFWKDRDLVYLGCNRQFAQDAGVSSDEIIGKTALDMPWAVHADFYHSDDREVMAADTPKLGIEEPLVKAGGDLRWLRTNKIPLHDADGEVVGVLATYEDITERKQMEHYVLRTERLAAMGRLAAALAHEINNPLQGIINSIELVLEFKLDEGRRRQYLWAVRREIERLQELSHRILDFARPPKVEPRPTYVTHIVRHALTLAEKQLQHSHIEVGVELSTDLPPVQASSDQLAQVFLNLIINAIEEMPDGGHLRIAARQVHDQVELTFVDDGPGIPPDQLPMIFEPFYTTKADGSGLGLAISHSILQQYGGSIAVHNASGGGAVFSITLPVCQPDHHRPPAGD